jgi:toxin-antitoxin system PIN domain toxin
MNFLVDTNILLYAANKASPEHAKAKRFLEALLSSATPWCLSWGGIYEFLRVSTHPRVFPKPLSGAQALRYLQTFLSREEITVLTPTSRHAELLGRTVWELSHPAGNLFHDIETAVLMREHGVREILTADTDFLQFPFLTVTNPLRSRS